MVWSEARRLISAAVKAIDTVIWPMLNSDKASRFILYADYFESLFPIKDVLAVVFVDCMENSRVGS